MRMVNDSGVSKMEHVLSSSGDGLLLHPPTSAKYSVVSVITGRPMRSSPPSARATLARAAARWVAVLCVFNSN